MKKLILVAMILVPSVALAAPPLVNPVTVNLGTPVHLTPHGYDAANVEVPITVGPGGQCAIVGFPSAGFLPTSLVTITYDSTGAFLTATGPGSGNAQWRCQSGVTVGTVVVSSSFAVTVPWNVTQVGDTSP